MASHTANLLKSVGKELFVTFFDDWTSPQIHEKIKAARDYSDNAVKTRVLKARRIRENAASTLEALEIISASANVSPAVAASAKAKIAAGKF